ncbi:hypothetical protein BRC62_02110 [Halobacteriales archaeon QH_10_67_13]|nr:MAG: hypothetical protein BRC62_02110 [Halobacteriales archaeon QH_10_67_13]
MEQPVAHAVDIVIVPVGDGGERIVGLVSVPLGHATRSAPETQSLTGEPNPRARPPDRPSTLERANRRSSAGKRISHGETTR